MQSFIFKKIKAAFLRLKFKLVISAGLTLGLMSLFQNCGKGFTSVTAENATQLSSRAQSEIPGNDAILNVQSPSLTITAKPALLIKDRRVEVRFTAQNLPEGSATYCRVDKVEFKTCAFNFISYDLIDGRHQVDIQIRSKENLVLTGTSLDFRVDGTSPDIMVNEAPPAMTGNAASISFLATDAETSVAQIECLFDNVVIQNCTSPQRLTSLSAGEHIFHLRVTDSIGNVSEKDIIFNVDLSIPTLAWSPSPQSSTKESTSTFQFAVTGELAQTLAPFTYKCRLDDGPATNCKSPLTVSNTVQGSHKLSVVAVGKNEVESSALNFSWVYDTKLPTLSVTLRPASYSTTTEDALITFEASDLGSGIKSKLCKIDFADYTACENSISAANLSLKQHNFSIRIEDNAGNVSIDGNLWTVIESIPIMKALYKQISAGTTGQICGIPADSVGTGSTIKCWGSISSFGIYSPGSLALNTSKPIPMMGTFDAQSLSTVDSANGCYITSAGALWCWRQGQASAVVPEVKRAKTVVALRTSTCALTTDGKVFCWGANEQGQLGFGHTTRVDIPTAIPDLLGIKVLVGRLNRYCVINNLDQVRCWGDNSDSVIATADPTKAFITKPSALTSLTSSAKDVAVGARHICALTSNNTVRCVGQSEVGQTGLPPGQNNAEVRTSTGTPLSNVTSITAGDSHTCAITADGQLYCWGNNYYGNLGSETPGTFSNAALKVALPEVALSVTLNGTSNCAILKNLFVYCWGQNNYGVLGLNNKTNLETASPLQNILGLQSVVTSGIHSCGITPNGRVQCWGLNESMSFGGSATLRTSVNAVEVPGVENAKQISTQFAGSCALSKSGQVSCWGSINPFTVQQTSLSNVSMIASGTHFTCALNGDRKVYCWGANYGSVLGIQDVNQAPFTTMQPTLIPGIENAIHISAGYFHACAVITDGKVKCWGSNNFGELGHSKVSSSLSYPVAQEVVGLPAIPFVQVSASGGHSSCALSLNGRVYCWGYLLSNENGMRLATQSPKWVQGLPAEAQQIVSGYNFTCALVKGGKTYCWGSNEQQQFGKITNRLFYLKATPALRGETGTEIQASPNGRILGLKKINGELVISGSFEQTYFTPQGPLLDSQY
jgi:alpha-tubulin suppressor-like RCC1 family protein